MAILSSEIAWKMVHRERSKPARSTAESGLVHFEVDVTRLNRTGSFESLIRWLCQRGAYLVFSESRWFYDPPPEEYLRDIFGWVECATRSEDGYASGSLIWYYVVPCHAGQCEPLLSFLNGLCDFSDGCPVENLAFFDDERFPLLRTVSHEDLAWLRITQQELLEARSSRQSWVQVIHA